MTSIDEVYSTLASGDYTAVNHALHEEVSWHVAHPVNDLRGPQQVIENFLKPLARALPDLERKAYIQLSGEDEGQHWVDGTGYLVGTFVNSLFGIPATGKTLYLRYTEMLRLEDGRIVEYYLIPDFLDAMLQAGVYPLRPGLGHPGLMMPPTTMDGICSAQNPGDHSYDESSKQLVLDMLECLRQYDGESLESMPLEEFWHPDFMWYGPGGIGTTRGISGFRQQHQRPFLRAFPDRDVDHHANTIACGDYIATGGWPHMHGTHSGGNWLGLPASQRHLSLRVMDIWRREGNRLRENWVAIDIPDMLMQMGLDVFAQIRPIKQVGD